MTNTSWGGGLCQHCGPLNRHINKHDFTETAFDTESISQPWEKDASPTMRYLTVSDPVPSAYFILIGYQIQLCTYRTTEKEFVVIFADQCALEKLRKSPG